MSVQPEVIAAKALVDYLRRDLPARVASINSYRSAVLESALAGPFDVPVDAYLRLSVESVEATAVEVPIGSGSRTAAQVAADIALTPTPGIIASADDWGRLVLTATAFPVEGVGSAIYVRSDADVDGASTGVNAAFGWAPGGEHVLVPALVAPSWRGVCDGWPMGGIGDMGPGFWVVLGDRAASMSSPNPRNDIYLVRFTVALWQPISPNGPPHRTREAIGSALRAVRELLESTEGRYLGRQAQGDIMCERITSTSVSATPTRLPDVGALFDTASLTITVRVFQRPD